MALLRSMLYDKELKRRQREKDKIEHGNETTTTRSWSLGTSPSRWSMGMRRHGSPNTSTGVSPLPPDDKEQHHKMQRYLVAHICGHIEAAFELGWNEAMQRASKVMLEDLL